ncbi:MAG: FMN-binding protein, partial [Clostridiales bacterium]|nr:FMN-binding protein [Clostridiales bacterium]
KDSFRSQYIGKSGTLAVTKDGGSIDSLTGATVTARAVTDGVNAALNAAKILG